jgi:hypothetical protein
MQSISLMLATVTDRPRWKAGAFVGTVQILAAVIRTGYIIFIFPIGAIRNAVTPSIQM